jgi:serine/threonine-protein kinase
MSPEQVRASRDVDARTDVWSLGVVLYELLTGRSPFDAESVPSLFVAIATQTPARVSSLREVPQALDRCVRRCLEKDRERRYASVAALAAALAPFAAVARAPSRVMRRAWAFVAAGAIVGGGVGAWRVTQAGRDASPVVAPALEPQRASADTVSPAAVATVATVAMPASESASLPATAAVGATVVATAASSRASGLGKTPGPWVPARTPGTNRKAAPRPPGPTDTPD